MKLIRGFPAIRAIKKSQTQQRSGFLVGEGGFEPPKSVTTDLQSAPFGHSGTLPYSIAARRKRIASLRSTLIGAGERIRTPDLLITNQLLYRLSYTSTSIASQATLYILSHSSCFVKRIFQKIRIFLYAVFRLTRDLFDPLGAPCFPVRSTNRLQRRGSFCARCILKVNSTKTFLQYLSFR